MGSNSRGRRTGVALWMALLATTVVTMPFSVALCPRILSRLLAHPALLAIPLMIVLALTAMLSLIRQGRYPLAFLALAMYVLLMSAGACLGLAPAPASDNVAMTVAPALLTGPHSLHVELLGVFYASVLALAFLLTSRRLSRGRHAARRGFGDRSVS